MKSPNLQIEKKIRCIETDEQFKEMSKEQFDFQSNSVIPFKEYLQLIRDVNTKFPPFLPIELFKSCDIVSQPKTETVFRSSGTTGSIRSSHKVHDAQLYEHLSIASFEEKYGSLSDWTILGLLPSYIENGDSSLVYMVKTFIEKTKNSDSSFVKSGPELNELLLDLQKTHRKTLLIGVSYALLDLADEFECDFPELTIMETGGMKGRRKELTRAELALCLKKSFPTSPIHSEYGMTELLSQAYAKEDGMFYPPKWMKAFVTSITDPFQLLDNGERGLLAYIDLANYYSCSFIQTRDIGVLNNIGGFTVEGRLDNSDIRGCNLLHP